MQKTPDVSIIVPIYNEEENIIELHKRLESVEQKSNLEFEYIYVDDGSKDNSFKLLKAMSLQKKQIKVLRFSRNFQHQEAVTAGINNCTGKCAVIIDADLQDPPELILEFLENWKNGYHVVYGQRNNREGESWMKLLTAKLFYRTLRKITDIEIPVDTGDFRLIDRKVIDIFNQFKEDKKFIRGLISWSGFKQKAVAFDRSPRLHGSTKYTYKKMFNFAWRGITSFSNFPLQVSTYLGFFSSVVAFAYILYVLYLVLFTDQTIQGWASVMVVTLFFGGVQLIVLGILGQYIGNIHLQTKERPSYIIEEKLNFD